MNDYQKQALVWDWDGFDESPEYEYWRTYAEHYGNKVLLPMCAHGKAGAYLAGNGLDVTAFDITPEMIAEGKKRYGSVQGLNLVVADITTLDLTDKNYDFTFIAGNGDLHLLPNIDTVETAFRSLYSHLRDGGCLALELTLPSTQSWRYPKREFQPRVPNYTGKKVWKANEGHYDANKKRHYINQTVFIEDDGGLDSFTQQVCLQYYERNEIVEALSKYGFTILGEYKNREKEPWTGDSLDWFIEAVKV
jgi:SAM-dependent methyltransferase